MSAVDRARALRQRATWAETLLWRWLRDRRFAGYKFRRQSPAAGYILDFYCEEARLCIELDGSRHGFPEAQRHDEDRDRKLAELGVKTLRFWNSRLRREGQSIRDTIFRELQSRAPHPLPEYTRPGRAGRGQSVPPHPDPLPQGEGTAANPPGASGTGSPAPAKACAGPWTTRDTCHDGRPGSPSPAGRGPG